MNEKCQVFTPNNYVEELLDSVGYRKDLYGKRILENSCGDGNILTVVVQRYIDDCKNNDFSNVQIREGLEKDIYGVEIDEIQYKRCIKNLNEILKRNRIGSVRWNIINSDYLRWTETIQFQFVVGNPPYITYQELEKEEQDYVRANFNTCKKGKFDYCYAFIEKSIKCLDRNGRMAYLIPSSIYKTVFGELLRNYMKPYIQEIRDYTQEKVFDNALVKSSILILSKARKSDCLHYFDMTTHQEVDIPISSLAEKWFFSNDTILGERRFGDYFQVSHVVATLLNDAYVLDMEKCTEDGDVYQCDGYRIEKAVVRETATPRSKRYRKKEKIIFPYMYENDKLVRYSEEQFFKQFPGAYGYLNQFRSKLDKRESDKSSLWFEYGRSQALAGLNRRKILVSTVITEKVPVYILGKEYIPYAGMYIVPKKDNKTYKLEDARAILKSDEFMQYVKRVGIHISGTSLRITSKDIENFKF